MSLWSTTSAPATLSDGDEALVSDQQAAIDVQTLQRVALGGDLSEPNIGHLRNIPRVQRRLLPPLLPLGRRGRHGLVGRRREHALPRLDAGIEIYFSGNGG